MSQDEQDDKNVGCSEEFAGIPGWLLISFPSLACLFLCDLCALARDLLSAGRLQICQGCCR